jgi:hypothetical protein
MTFVTGYRIKNMLHLALNEKSDIHRLTKRGKGYAVLAGSFGADQPTLEILSLSIPLAHLGTEHMCYCKMAFQKWQNHGI